MKTTINSFEDACKFLNRPAEAPDAEKFGKATTALHKLMAIIEARNKEADPEFKGFDWNDYDQYKWRPWFDMEKTDDNPSGFRFRGTICADAGSDVGSRLSTISEELCIDIAEKHIDLYRDFMVVE